MCIRGNQKSCFAKAIFGVERMKVSNFCGHEGNEYLGVRWTVTKEHTTSGEEGQNQDREPETEETHKTTTMFKFPPKWSLVDTREKDTKKRGATTAFPSDVSPEQGLPVDNLVIWGDWIYRYLTPPFSFSFIFTSEGMELSGDMGRVEGGNSLLLWAATKMMWPQAPIHVPARTGKIWSLQPFEKFRFLNFRCGVPDNSISSCGLLRGPVQNYRICRIDRCAPFHHLFWISLPSLAPTLVSQIHSLLCCSQKCL